MEAIVRKKDESGNKKYTPLDSIVSKEDLAMRRLADKAHKNATKDFEHNTAKTDAACSELTKKMLKKLD